MSGSLADPIRVLHVDDDREFVDLAATFLERQGSQITVRTATSARDGLAVLDDAVDCVVSDYEMPRKDGIEFLEAVRADRPNLPFVLFTGKGSEEIASDAISAGVTDYLQKEGGTDQYAVLANRIENAVSRQRTEYALDAARERMEFGLDVTDSIVFEVDLETRTERRHGPFERLFGIASERVQTSEAFFDRCVHPEDRDHVSQFQDPSDLPDGTDTVEYEFRTHPDYGEVRWMRTEVYVDAGPSGEPRRLIGLNTDVTDREQRQRELERQNERLDEFASLVSHDLRNPLNVAESWLELAQESNQSEPLDKAVRALDRMDALIDDLLTLAREGERATDPEAVDLVEVVEDCWRGVETKRARLVVEPDLWIRADRSRLRQLLENLLRNAVEHGSTSSPPQADDAVEHGDVVTITVGELDDRDGVYVADAGPGIPVAERGDVFEAGYSTAEDGTGFGLRIVDQIAEVHGWTVDVVESEDGGARFEVAGVEYLER